MKRARVAYGGAIHDAVEHGAGVRLTDGRVLAEDAVVWLPPFEPETIIALGLNYADHVKELSKELTVTAKDEPLAFLKSPGALIGHRGQTRRPADATFMHYECELAVVIGRSAKQVSRADALNYVAGYTVANGNRITNDGTWTYTYNADEQRTKKSKGASLETWTYEYDLQGHLTSPRSVRFDFQACDGNVVVIDGIATSDLLQIPGTYTHPDGPPQPMVLTRQ